ncbi:hTAFII28-like protein conserved region-domain-containing protein [Haematococcus lacustris]
MPLPLGWGWTAAAHPGTGTAWQPPLCPACNMSTAGEADAAATPGEGVEVGVEAADVSDEGDDQMAEEGGGAEQPETEAEEVEAKGSQGTDNDREELDKRAKVMLAMNEEQLNRYDAYRNSALPRPKIKRLLQQLMGVAPTEKATIAMCGIGKLFVGEVVEMARYLAGLEGYHGPLLPRHIQRAYQQLDAAQRVPHTSTRLKRLFR